MKIKIAIFATAAIVGGIFYLAASRVVAIEEFVAGVGYVLGWFAVIIAFQIAVVALIIVVIAMLCIGETVIERAKKRWQMRERRT